MHLLIPKAETRSLLHVNIFLKQRVLHSRKKITLVKTPGPPAVLVDFTPAYKLLQKATPILLKITHHVYTFKTKKITCKEGSRVSRTGLAKRYLSSLLAGAFSRAQDAGALNANEPVQEETHWGSFAAVYRSPPQVWIEPRRWRCHWSLPTLQVSSYGALPG